MYRSKHSSGRWTLTIDGTIVAEHTARCPFITAVRQEKTYAAVRDGVKAQAREIERVPLKQVLLADAEHITFIGGNHRVCVSLSERCGGVQLALRGEAGWGYEFRLPAIEGEAVFGGGAQCRNVDLRGEQVVNFASERINTPATLQNAFPPRFLHCKKEQRHTGSYAPAPVFVTDCGRLMLFDTTADGLSSFGTDAYHFRFDHCPDALLLAYATDYPALAAVLAARFPNRQYLPDWCHNGMILSVRGDAQTVLEKTFAMLDAGAAVSGVWSPDWCETNRTAVGKQVCEIDETIRPCLRSAIRQMNERGVRFLASVSPCLTRGSRLYEYCREHGWLITRPGGEVYRAQSAAFDFGMIDLTNPDAVFFVKNTLIRKNMLELGVSGWMADLGGFPPFDCALHSGDPLALHNEWPALWAKINRQAIEESGRTEDIFFFINSGYMGVQEYAPLLWNSGQRTSCGKDFGASSVMSTYFSLGFSAVPMAHCDTGVFLSFGRRKCNTELLIRRMEMRAFSLLFYFDESIFQRVTGPFDAEAVVAHRIRLSNVHKALKPYLAKCVREAKAGLPALRPDFYAEMAYSASHDPHSYFLGNDLYVCPVIRPQAHTRKVFLPKGVWVHFWTGKVYAGGDAYAVPAPLGEAPVFYRANCESIALFRAAAAIASQKPRKALCE